MRAETTPMSAAKSVEAVQQYICYKKGNDDRHQALVLTSEKEESYPVVHYVYAQVMANSAKVIVEWNGSCGRDYPYEFTTSNSRFSFSYKSLRIESKDTFGHPISVSISVIG